MNCQVNQQYYVIRKPKLLQEFDNQSQYWKPLIVNHYGGNFARTVLSEACQEFDSLIPMIPYIGGADNHLTESLIESVIYLSFHLAMQKHHRTAEETGKILFDSILTRLGEPRPPIPPAKILSTEQLMMRRRERATRSQLRSFPGDYVFEFIAGKVGEFDYGYDFIECAAQKFYHAQGADEFLPFYCFLDFAWSRVYELGLSRTMTLAQGHPMCNHRFKQGSETAAEWPTPYMKGA
jgi:hypothetical protein